MSHEELIRKFYASKINASIGSSTDLSFSESGDFSKTFLRFLSLKQLDELRLSLKNINDEAESHFLEKDMRWKFLQSQRNGVAREISRLIEERTIEKQWWRLSNEAVELKKLIQDRIKSETPTVFHQFINICDFTVERLLGGDLITLHKVEEIKDSLDSFIESLKYSCLFESLGPKLHLLLNELKSGEIQASSLPMISQEMYYLVCYEAASKYIEIISGGTRSLNTKTLDDYFITEVGSDVSGRKVTLDIVECSVDRMKLTLVDSEDSKERLNAAINEKLSSLEKGLAEKILKWGKSQRRHLISPDGKYKGIKIEAVPGSFANHEDLFQQEVLVHKEASTLPSGELVSKYSVKNASDRTWETNSIVIDLSRHIKGTNLEGLIPEKFNVRVLLHSRCAKFVSVV